MLACGWFLRRSHVGKIKIQPDTRSNWPRAQRNYIDWRAACLRVHQNKTESTGEETIIISAHVILYLTSSARRVFVEHGGAIASHIAGSDRFSALLAGRVVNVARCANLQSKLIKFEKKKSSGGQKRTGMAHTHIKNHYSQWLHTKRKSDRPN